MTAPIQQIMNKGENYVIQFIEKHFMDLSLDNIEVNALIKPNGSFEDDVKFAPDESCTYVLSCLLSYLVRHEKISYITVNELHVTNCKTIKGYKQLHNDMCKASVA